MRTCIAATRKVSHVFIYTYKLKVSGAHAPLGPTVDTPMMLTVTLLKTFTVSYKDIQMATCILTL